MFLLFWGNKYHSVHRKVSVNTETQRDAGSNPYYDSQAGDEPSEGEEIHSAAHRSCCPDGQEEYRQ